MPYVNNDGVSIHYQVDGDGPPLVLLHGVAGSAEQWRYPDYVTALKDACRLIRIDARGHGASDKPHAPQAYKMSLLATDVVAVLDDLHIGKAHYFGYSFGGWVGWGIAKYAPERFHSLIIGGSSPLFKKDLEASNPFLELFQKGMDAVLAALELMYGSWWAPEIKAVVQANDLEALSALVSADDWLDFLIGFEDVLPTVTVPCLVYVGEDDYRYPGARDGVKHMPNATFVSFPGVDHVGAFSRADLVVPQILKFLAGVSEG